MTGRRILRLLPVLAATLLLSVCSKTPTLNLLVWEGYADPSFIKAFEEQNHCKVTASYMGSSDELMAKLRGGSAGNYDVISPSSDVATSITTSGLAAPSRLVEDSELQPTFFAAYFPASGARERTSVWRAIHVGAGSHYLRHNRFRAASRLVERDVGSEVQRKSFCVGRFVDRVHGGAGAGLRQA